MPPSAALLPLALMGVAVLLAPALAAGSPAAAELRRAALAETGLEVAIDPRLEVPACPLGFRFEPRGTTLAVTCPATGWRLVAPLAREDAASSRATIRRGDRVKVAWAGPGFRVTLDAIAEGTGGPGDRILLRNPLTGHRFPATIATDGHATAGS